MNENRRNAYKAIIIFLCIAVLVSSVFYWLIGMTGNLLAGDRLFVIGLMWAPGVAALITCAMIGKDVRDLGWEWGNTKFEMMGYVIPIIYAGIVYSFIWFSGLGGFGNPEFVAKISADFGWQGLSSSLVIALYVLFRGTIHMVVASAYALGEEIGWRGFLVPELLKTTTFTKTALISGFIWATWHLPTFLFSNYNAGTPPLYGFSCFFVMIVGLSFLLAWLRLKSGSLWPTVFLHASHNLFIQRIFEPLTTKTPITPYVSDEFGIGLAIAATLIAFICWRKRNLLVIGVAGFSPR